MIDSLNIVYGYLHVRIKLSSASESCDPSCKNFFLVVSGTWSDREYF